MSKIPGFSSQISRVAQHYGSKQSTRGFVANLEVKVLWHIQFNKFELFCHFTIWRFQRSPFSSVPTLVMIESYQSCNVMYDLIFLRSLGIAHIFFNPTHFSFYRILQHANTVKKSSKFSKTPNGVFQKFPLQNLSIG